MRNFRYYKRTPLVLQQITKIESDKMWLFLFLLLTLSMHECDFHYISGDLPLKIALIWSSWYLLSLTPAPNPQPSAFCKNAATCAWETAMPNVAVTSRLNGKLCSCSCWCRSSVCIHHMVEFWLLKSVAATQMLVTPQCALNWLPWGTRPRLSLGTWR